MSPWSTLWSMAPGAGVSDESHLLSGLVRQGWEIDLLVPRAATVAESAPGIRVHTFPNVLGVDARIPAPLRRLWLLPAFWTVASRAATRLARVQQPRIVIGFSHYGAWPAWKAARAVGARSVLKLFGVMHAMRLDWPLPRYLYHSLEGVLAFKVPVDHFIVLDDGTRGNEVAQRWGVPAEKITWLPNGIDLEWRHLDVDRAAVRREIGADSNAVAVLSLSRLVLSKRVDRIVEAMAVVQRQSRRPVELWIAGDGDERAKLEALCRDRAVRARFLGTVPHARVPYVCRAADVFVSTSTLTNMSIPTCEAMVMGKPVVALDVGGTSQVVRHEETGLLVAEEDAPGLAAAIGRLVDDEPFRDALGDRAARFAAQHFMDWETRVGHEIALLDRLAGGAP